MSEVAGVESVASCNFVQTKNLSNSQSNVNLFFCKTIEGESFFIVKSLKEHKELVVESNGSSSSMDQSDWIYQLNQHVQFENQHFYFHRSRNLCKIYVDFLDQMKGQSFSSTEWNFSKLLNDGDILRLCWQIIYLFNVNSTLVNRETMFIEKMEDGSIQLKVFPIGVALNKGNEAKTSKRLANFLLEILSIYLDLPYIPENEQEVGKAIEMIENLPSNNDLLIQCILPTLKICIETENPDLYQVFTLFLLQMVNLDSQQYWRLLSTLKSNTHKRTVADIWIESQKLFEQKQFEKALNTIFEIKEFSKHHPIISYMTGKIYYELYRKSFYQLHYPGDVTLLGCASQFFSQASNLSKKNVEYLERKVECNLRKWILDNELNLDKSNQTMNELSSELDYLIELNPKSSPLYSMKSTLYFIHYLRFGILADKSHISIILTFAEVARSNSPTDPIYQLMFELVSSMFTDSGSTNIETNDSKLLLIQAIILDLSQKDNDQIIQNLKQTDYRQTILDALWHFPMLNEQMTITVTGNVLIAKTNDKYKSIMGKLNYKYIKDDETKVCMKCQTKFSLVNRRHHCRFCGKIFCNACSSKKIKYRNEEEKRSCEDCFSFLSIEFAPLNKLESSSTNGNPPSSSSSSIQPNHLLSIDCQQFFKQQIQSVCSQSICHLFDK